MANKTLEEEVQILRAAITGWSGYAWKNGEYIDDLGEYFAAFLPKETP